MCGFDIRCAAEQETEVNGMGNRLLIILDIGPEWAPPVPYRKILTQLYNVWKKEIWNAGSFMKKGIMGIQNISNPWLSLPNVLN